MPIVSCTQKNGKPGFKVENTNNCVPTRKKALEILRAIKSQQKKNKSSVVSEALDILAKDHGDKPKNKPKSKPKPKPKSKDKDKDKNKKK